MTLRTSHLTPTEYLRKKAQRGRKLFFALAPLALVVAAVLVREMRKF